jgi:curved DNA-binding protein CbpA
MTNAADYYQILGVLHDAEQIVITAAYRALASMYHPDRWKGDKAEATRRMADINVAYGVIGDPVKRAAYDKDRGRSTSTFAQESESADQAFDQALSELEARWQTAVDVIPDLADIRKRLAKTAHRLAFSFVVEMLDGKKFQNRKEIAERMEQKFLETYFGSNPSIIDFARLLIKYGEKEAVRSLNKYVDVLGSDLDSTLIIQKIKDKFPSIFQVVQNSTRVRDAKQKFMGTGSLESAIALTKASGYFIAIRPGAFLDPTDLYSVFDSIQGEKGTLILETVSPDKFISWVKKTLCV